METTTGRSIELSSPEPPLFEIPSYGHNQTIPSFSSLHRDTLWYPRGPECHQGTGESNASV